MNDSAPDTREQYSAHLPALHLLANLGWHYLTVAECLTQRGSTREVLLKPRLIEGGRFSRGRPTSFTIHCTDPRKSYICTPIEKKDHADHPSERRRAY